MYIHFVATDSWRTQCRDTLFILTTIEQQASLAESSTTSVAKSRYFPSRSFTHLAFANISEFHMKCIHIFGIVLWECGRVMGGRCLMGDARITFDSHRTSWKYFNNLSSRSSTSDDITTCESESASTDNHATRDADHRKTYSSTISPKRWGRTSAGSWTRAILDVTVQCYSPDSGLPPNHPLVATNRLTRTCQRALRPT